MVYYDIILKISRILKGNVKYAIIDADHFAICIPYALTYSVTW